MKKKTQELWSVVQVIGGKKLKKMRFKGFKTKEQRQNHGPYISCKNNNILGTMNGIIHYNS
jgi:hypothetical protein